MKMKNGSVYKVKHEVESLVYFIHNCIKLCKNKDNFSRVELISILEVCKDRCRKAVDNINEAIDTEKED